MLRASTARRVLQRSLFRYARPSGNGGSPCLPTSRLHGTVTAFKHRRGYGFVLAEGFVKDTNALDASASRSTPSGGVNPPVGSTPEDIWLGETYFFARSHLGGGFYVTEGERVSFNIKQVEPGKGLYRRLGESAYEKVSQTGSMVEGGPTGSKEPSGNDPGKDHLSLKCAHRFRLYDPVTQKESRITPITLNGKMVQWDAVEGRGTIAELDVEGQLHADAPRFTVALEDMDLGGGTCMHEGRYVRFCIDVKDDATAARRVIADLTAEKKHGVIDVPVHSSTAMGGVEKTKRFFGTVREVVENRFGFVTDDLTGESIFFHLSNTTDSRVRTGERVSYLLREIAFGKHKGKKACFDVRADTYTSPMGDPADELQDEEDEFDLLD